MENFQLLREKLFFLKNCFFGVKWLSQLFAGFDGAYASRDDVNASREKVGFLREKVAFLRENA